MNIMSAGQHAWALELRKDVARGGIWQILNLPPLDMVLSDRIVKGLVLSNEEEIGNIIAGSGPTVR